MTLRLVLPRLEPHQHPLQPVYLAQPHKSSDNFPVVSDPSDGNTSLTGQQEKMAGKPVKKGFNIESLLGRVEGESSPKRMKLGGRVLYFFDYRVTPTKSLFSSNSMEESGSDKPASEDALVAPQVDNVRIESEAAPALELKQSGPTEEPSISAAPAAGNRVSDSDVVEDAPVAPQPNQNVAARKHQMLTKFLEIMARCPDEKKEMMKSVLSKMLEGIEGGNSNGLQTLRDLILRMKLGS
ncbi:unnamed protein product [Caenorhabditis brenneri]